MERARTKEQAVHFTVSKRLRLGPQAKHAPVAQLDRAADF